VRRSKVFWLESFSDWQKVLLRESSVEPYFLHQAEFFRARSPGGDAPEVDRQATRQRHEGFLAGRRLGFAIFEQRPPLAHRPISRLKAADPPGQFDHQAA
jgi:hypothetical protein